MAVTPFFVRFGNYGALLCPFAEATLQPLSTRVIGASDNPQKLFTTCINSPLVKLLPFMLGGDNRFSFNLFPTPEAVVASTVLDSWDSYPHGGGCIRSNVIPLDDLDGDHGGNKILNFWLRKRCL